MLPMIQIVYHNIDMYYLILKTVEQKVVKNMNFIEVIEVTYIVMN